MATKTGIARKLKVGADPRQAFEALAALNRDLPGARAWGSAERGFTVALGAGFDFGPLLTFGAPIITAEVGAALSVGTSSNLVVLLDRNAQNQLTLSRLSGYSVILGGMLEAKGGVGIPEKWTETSSMMVPDVPTIGLKGRLEEHTLANPLAPEEPEEEEEEEEEPAEETEPLPNDGDVEDRADAALQSLQKDDSTPEDHPASDGAQGALDLRQGRSGTADESADKVLDIHAMGKVEASVGLRYLIVREPSPLRLESMAAVDAAMAAFISDSQKSALKEEVEAFIAEHTMAEKTAGTQGIDSAVQWMSKVAEAKRTDEWARLNERLLACRSLSKTSLEALRGKVEELYVLQTEPGSLKPLKLCSLPNFGLQIKKWRRDSALFPTHDQFVQAQACQADYAKNFQNNQGVDSNTKETWKKNTRGLLKSTFGELTTSAELAAALKRTITAGECSWYDPYPSAPMPGARPLYDQITELGEHIDGLKKDGLQFTGDDSAIKTSIATVTSQVLKDFRGFLKKNGNLVSEPPTPKRFGNRSTADLVAKLQEIGRNNPALAAGEYAELLTKLKSSEKDELKNRAVAMLVSAGQADKLPAWPRKPATKDLTTKLTDLAKQKPPKVKSEEVNKLIEELNQLAAETEQAAQTAADPASQLTYISLLGFSGGGGASAVAKAKLRFALGVNELGVHAKAGAQMEGRAEAINVRTQGYTDDKNDQKTVRTQDVKIRRWAFTAEAAAEAKAGNKTVGEASTGIKESGRIRWSGATGYWTFPPTSQDTVELKMGSGVCFGRSAGRERFSSKMEDLRKANPGPKPGNAPTPYVTRLAQALRVNEKLLTRCLLQLFPTTDDESTLADQDVLYFESRWSVSGNGQFKLRGPGSPSLVQKLREKLGVKTPLPPPPTEINDLRKALVPAFSRNKKNFRLQSIAIRVKLGDEPEEKEKTLFQFAHEYIVVATAAVTSREATRTAAMPDALVWWSNPKFRRIETGDSPAAKEKLYQQAVPPLFLLDV